MTTDLPDTSDVVIVGAGPAGLSAAVELRALGVASVLVLDREAQPGGVPRLCGHSPYGLREFHRPMLGPAYAERLAARARAAGADIRTGVTVTALRPGPLVAVSSDAGLAEISARLVLIATGVRESSRAARLIGGTKPGGVLSTGALQGLVYGHGLRPFRRPVVLGSELVAFSALLTCRHAGIRPVAMIEPSLQITARCPADLLPRLLGVPLRLNTRIVAIEGRDSVDAVVVASGDREDRIETDGVLVTGAFRPEATLIRASHLAYDPLTGGPEVDQSGRCSDPAFFAAGNLLRPVETAGWCWAEGRAVARAMAAQIARQGSPEPGTRIALSGDALAYAMPQRLSAHGFPALDRLQLRVSRPFAGRLSLRVNGHQIAGRTISARPERRIFLPLPPAEGDIEVRLGEGEP